VSDVDRSDLACGLVCVNADRGCVKGLEGCGCKRWVETDSDVTCGRPSVAYDRASRSGSKGVRSRRSGGFEVC
jgi:hypothetical protein